MATDQGQGAPESINGLSDTPEVRHQARSRGLLTPQAPEDRDLYTDSEPRALHHRVLCGLMCVTGEKHCPPTLAQANTTDQRVDPLPVSNCSLSCSQHCASLLTCPSASKPNSFPQQGLCCDSLAHGESAGELLRPVSGSPWAAIHPLKAQALYHSHLWLLQLARCQQHLLPVFKSFLQCLP